MKISARNQLKGKVDKIEEGAVNGIVTVDIGGGQKIVSSITMSSIKNLALKPGSEVYVLIKASSVMLATD